MFKIGDKVRMLRSSESGVVVKIKGNIIEFETTDGFELPVVASDLVKVAEAEKEFFRTPEAEKEESVIEAIIKKNNPTEPEIGLGFEPVNDFLMRPYFINNTDSELFFVLSIKRNGIYENFAAGQCKAESEARIYEDLKKDEFENWSKWQIQLLSFEKNKESQSPRVLEIVLKAKKLFSEILEFPFTTRKGYINILALKEAKAVGEPIEVSDSKLYYEQYNFDKERTIDLHAEVLGISERDAKTIMEQQFDAFQKEIELSIAENVMELTVIHGVGSGILRKYIHKDLVKNEHVEWFKDAQKEKFGYGATLIHFKA